MSEVLICLSIWPFLSFGAICMEKPLDYLYMGFRFSVDILWNKNMTNGEELGRIFHLYNTYFNIWIGKVFYITDWGN